MTDRNGQAKNPRSGDKVIRRVQQPQPDALDLSGLPPGATRTAWGWTKNELTTPGFRVEKLSVDAGGYSSKHYHSCQHNMFYVESGAIAVVLYDEKCERTTRIDYLGVGQSTIVPARRIHGFEVMTDAVVIATYWTSSKSDCASPTDIVRLSMGGKICPSQLPSMAGFNVMRVLDSSEPLA